MSAARTPREQSSLFDLEPSDEGDREESRGDPTQEPEPLDLPLREGAREEDPAEGTPAAGESSERRAPPEDRVMAGLLDLGLHLAVAVGLLAVLWLLGIPIGARAFVALGVVLLAFSFFYTVIPLAFWRATPGMAARDLVSRAEGGEPLTFGQAARRWLAGVSTVALAGIPALMTLTGRSLADRWSRSSTLRGGAPPPG